MKEKEQSRYQQIEAELTEARAKIQNTGVCYLRPQVPVASTDNPAYYAMLTEKQYLQDSSQDFKSFTGINPEKVSSDVTPTRGWVCDYRDIADADTEPRLLCASLGVNYDQDKDYQLAVMELPETVEVTRADAAGLATIGDKYMEADQAIYESALLPEKQIDYQKIYQSDNKDLNDNYERAEFINHHSNDTSSFTPDELAARTEMHATLGVNEYYKGDGKTQTNGDVPGVDVGEKPLSVANEYVAVDTKPHTIGELNENGFFASFPCQNLEQENIKLTNDERELADAKQMDTEAQAHERNSENDSGSWAETMQASQEATTNEVEYEL